MVQDSGHASTQNSITNSAAVSLTNITRLRSNRRPALTPDQLYESLPLSVADRSVRLLDLDAATEDAPLSGRLWVASLALSPRFAALSYVWGGYSEPKDIISCNDGYYRINITSNCRDALLALRRRYGAVTVWVDAICINQADDIEKVVQIELMNEIYTWAHTTIVWLGRGDVFSDMALTWLAKNSRAAIITDIFRFGSAPTQAGRVLAWCNILASIITDPFEQGVAWLRLGRGHDDKNRSWQEKLFWKGRIHQGFDPAALDHLFSKAWFQRAWTFQEYILSTNQIFLCGEKAISGDNLIGGLETLFKGFEGTSIMPKISRSVLSMRDLVVAWMNVSRLTRWNDEEPVRRPHPLATLRAYQQTALATLLEPSTILTLWIAYALTISAIIFAVTFTVVIILGIIPAVLRREVPQLLTASWITPLSLVGLGLTFSLGILVMSVLSDMLKHIQGRGHSRFRRGNLRFPSTCRQPGFTLPPASSTVAARKREDSASSEDNFNKSEDTKPQDSETVHLAAILHVLRERDATNPRDRSFALHGVLSRLEGFRLTSVGYSSSRTRVYQALVADFLRWRPDMINLLLDAGWSRAEVMEEQDPAPSWVPDWDVVSKKHTHTQNPGLFAPDRYYRPHEQSFATDGWPMRVEVDGDRLRVAGAWIGHIALSTGRFSSVSSVMGLANAVMSAEDRHAALQAMNADALLWTQMTVLAIWVLYCRRNMALAYDSVPDAMYTILRGVASLAQGLKHAQEARNEFSALFRVLSAVKPAILDRAAAGLPGEAEQELRRLFGEREDGMLALNLAVRYINEYLAERRALFITDGGYIGTGTTGVQIGDRLALIAGVSVPMVLREKSRGGGEFVVVGPAFVPGFMGSGDVEMMTTEMITLV